MRGVPYCSDIVLGHWRHEWPILTMELIPFQVNVATGDIYRLFSADTPIEGTKGRIFNDLDIADDGTIYLSVSSSRWNRNQFVYEVIEAQPTGRSVF